MQKTSIVATLLAMTMFSTALPAAEEEWFDYWWKVSQANKALSEARIDELEKKNLPKCRNILVGGPIATQFESALLLTQMNSRTGYFSTPSPAIVKEFNEKMNAGIRCRSNYPYGLNCSGIGYLDPVVGEVVRVNRSRYKKFGELTEFYVQAMVRWPGSSDFFLVHAEKRNTRCSGNPEGPGIATGLPGVNNGNFIFW